MSNIDKVKNIVSIIRKTSDDMTIRATLAPVLEAELSFKTEVTIDGNIANIYVEETSGDMVLLTIDLS
jgi:hypothetical protein